MTTFVGGYNTWKSSLPEMVSDDSWEMRSILFLSLKLPKNCKTRPRDFWVGPVEVPRRNETFLLDKVFLGWY